MTKKHWAYYANDKFYIIFSGYGDDGDGEQKEYYVGEYSLDFGGNLIPSTCALSDTYCDTLNEAMQSFERSGYTDKTRIEGWTFEKIQCWANEARHSRKQKNAPQCALRI